MLAIVTVVLGAGALALAASLAALTAHLSDSAANREDAVSRVRLGQQATIELLLVDRANDPVFRRAHANALRADVRKAAAKARPGAERRAYGVALATSEAYLDAAEAGDPDAAALLHPAYTALTEAVELNLTEARAARLNAERWEEEADWIGIAAIVVFFAAAAVTWWLRRAVRPMLGLAATLEQYSAGDRRARAREAGPPEVRAMAAGINHLADALRGKDEARATLLKSIAHDLRTPLAALRLSLEVLASKEPPTPHMQRGLERLKRQLDRFNRLVGDVSDLAQVETDDFRLKLQDCDAAAVVRDVVGLYEEGARGHPIAVTAPPEGVHITADPWRLEQVVGNLLTNAVKYSPPASPISVTVEGSGHTATIAVADRGPGIPPEQRARLFEPYWRGAVGTIPGAGLGLFITRRIVEAHGGTVRVADRPDGGTVFLVSLPAA